MTKTEEEAGLGRYLAMLITIPPRASSLIRFRGTQRWSAERKAPKSHFLQLVYELSSKQWNIILRTEASLQKISS